MIWPIAVVKRNRHGKRVWRVLCGRCWGTDGQVAEPNVPRQQSCGCLRRDMARERAKKLGLERDWRGRWLSTGRGRIVRKRASAGCVHG